MRPVIRLGLVVASILPATLVYAQGDRTLVGTYKVVSGKRGDKDIPKDHLHSSVRITPETMTAFDKDNNEAYVMRYNLEPGKEPRRITMTITKSTRPEAVGSKARGLIQAEGNRVMLIYDEEGEDFPKQFEPKADKQHFFVLERTGEN